MRLHNASAEVQRERVRLHRQAESRRRRAHRGRVAVDPIFPEELHAHWEEVGLYACAYCDAPWEHVDHVTPIALGGADEIGNLVPACAHCNLSKGPRHVSAWRPALYAAALPRSPRP